MSSHKYGCTRVFENGLIVFTADSDALITKGPGGTPDSGIE